MPSSSGNRKKHKLIAALGFVIGLAVLAGLVLKTGPEKIWESLVAFGPQAFLIFFGLSLLNFALYTWRWKLILNGMGQKKNVKFMHLFAHRMSGFATGYLTPGSQVAGEPIRVALLHSEGVPTQEATGSVVLDLAFETVAFLAYIIAGVILALISGIQVGLLQEIGAVFIVALLVILIIFFTSVAKGWNLFHRFFERPFFKKRKWGKGFSTWILQVEELMTTFFAGHPGRLALVVLLSFCMMAFRAVEVLIITYFFHSPTTVSGAFFLSTIPGLVLFLPIPGGLGLFEASNAAMLATLGITVNPVAYTMIIRLRDLLFIAWGVLHGVKSGTAWLDRKK